MRVLFTSQAGSGHWRPLLPLALVAAGHEVAFATTPIACPTLRRLGWHCFPVGIGDWLGTLGLHLGDRMLLWPMPRSAKASRSSSVVTTS